MNQLRHQQWAQQQWAGQPGPVSGLERGGRWLKSLLLRAFGARPLTCDYCASAIPFGDVHCPGCGATATLGAPPKPSRRSAPSATTGGAGRAGSRPWLVPLLLCILFPPALLVVLPVLFWRWLRRGNTGWILPLLICVVFPPAVLLVAPALLWRRPPEG